MPLKQSVLIIDKDGQLPQFTSSKEISYYYFNVHNDCFVPPDIKMEDFDLCIKDYSAFTTDYFISEETFSELLKNSKCPFIIVSDGFSSGFNLNQKRSEYYRGSLWRYHKNSATKDDILKGVHEALQEQKTIQKKIPYVCCLAIKDGKIYLTKKRHIYAFPGGFCEEQDEKLYLQNLENPASIYYFFESFKEKSPWGDYECRVYLGIIEKAEKSNFLDITTIENGCGMPRYIQSAVAILKKKLLL